MAEATVQSNPNKDSRSTLEVVVDRIWRFFTSVRNAVYEIAFLTLLVLIGTLRGSSVPQWIADGIPALEPLVDRWYAWDVYRSALFAGTLALITVAISTASGVSRAVRRLFIPPGAGCSRNRSLRNSACSR